MNYNLNEWNVDREVGLLFEYQGEGYMFQSRIIGKQII